MNLWIRQRGKTLGPLPLDKVLSAYAAGKFAGDAEVSDDQVNWRPITDLSGLAAQAAQPVAPPVPAVPQVPPQVYPPTVGESGYPFPQDVGSQPMANGYPAPPPPPPQGYGAFQTGYGQQVQGQGSYCRACGAPVTPQAAICLRCGANPKVGNAFCPTCGAQTNPSQAICLQCGTGLQGSQGFGGFSGSGKMIQPSGKSASTAVLLSCLLNGAGQMYLGQTMKGVAILVGSIVLGVLTGGIATLPILIINLIDASKIGKKLESGQSVGEWEFFWNS